MHLNHSLHQDEVCAIPIETIITNLHVMCLMFILIYNFLYRYCTYFILMERMVEVHEALQLMVVNPEWGQWSRSKSSEGKAVRQRILDESWWSTMK